MWVANKPSRTVTRQISSLRLSPPPAGTSARGQREEIISRGSPDSRCRSTPNLFTVRAEDRERLSWGCGDGSGHVFASVSSSWFAVVIIVLVASQPGFMHTQTHAHTLSRSASLSPAHARAHTNTTGGSSSRGEDKD